MGVDWKKIGLFVLITFAVSWTLALAFMFGGGRAGSAAALVMASLYMLVPLAATLAIQKLLYRQPVIRPFGVSLRLNRWLLVAWLLPTLWAWAALGTGLLLPGVRFDPDMSGVIARYAPLLTAEQLATVEQQLAQADISL